MWDEGVVVSHYHIGARVTETGKNWESKQVLDRAYSDTPEYKKLTKGNAGVDATLVLIMLGANDCKRPCNLTNPWINAEQKEFKVDYKKIIDAMKRLPRGPDVFLVSATPLYHDGSYNLSQHCRNTVLNTKLKELTRENKLPEMIDVYKDWQTHHCPTKMGAGEPEGQANCNKMHFDGEHHTKKGAMAIAQFVHNRLQPHLAKSPWWLKKKSSLLQKLSSSSHKPSLSQNLATRLQ